MALEVGKSNPILAIISAMNIEKIGSVLGRKLGQADLMQL
jgi:hypothetical protein